MMGRKPKLGQHFLTDDGARLRIIDALGDVNGRTVLEIGPGRGAITALLAGHAGKLICVELDCALAAALRFHYRDRSDVEIVEADIRQTDLPALSTGAALLRVVGNLPYYITSEILLQLCAAAEHIDLAIVMMQREVAERVCAVPGTRDYGLLSVTVQTYADPGMLFLLPPESFSPPPEVVSAVVRLRFQSRLQELDIRDTAGWTRFLRAAFQQKRKTLLNNLRAAGYAPESVNEAAAAAGTALTARAEELAIEELAALYGALHPSG